LGFFGLLPSPVPFFALFFDFEDRVCGFVFAITAARDFAALKARKGSVEVLSTVVSVAVVVPKNYF
jgi:hypothetical protein